MTKLGILVGEDKWTFFEDIFNDLSDHYRTDIYKRKVYSTPLLYGRLNRWAYRNGIGNMLQRNDICFFEWASEHLMVASHMPKCCIIITRLHSFELYDWASKVNWDVVDKVILVSNAMRQKFVDLYSDQVHKTEVVYNGVTLDVFKPSLQRAFNFNLGMLSNIVPIKRIYEIVLMMSILKGQGSEPHLHIAGKPMGENRYSVAIHRLIDKLDLKENVTFYGFVTDTPTWLQMIDIFISNSYWEGQPVSLLEAMASGCFCLAHHWDGAKEVLPGENLYLTESELLQKIIEYSEKSNAEKRICQEHMRDIACEKFDQKSNTVEIREIIEETLDKKH